VITVTNAKVAGFVPQWASFRGFSILFDSPGDSLRYSDGCGLLACDVDRDPLLGFYRQARDALASLDLRHLTHRYLFCPLPSTSYHVTVWDGANDGNVGKIAAPQRAVVEQLLADVPAALQMPHELIQLALRSALVQRQDWNLAFRFSQLALVGDSVLVAELEPATSDDSGRLQELIRCRSELSARVQAAYGFSPYERYWPHVSLGYFANRELAQLARPYVEQWNASFVSYLSGRTLTFTRARVYGFNDMATFYSCDAEERLISSKR
jgi:hypothetical protein